MLDQKIIRRAFERAAPDFERHAFLHREIRDRLLERLVAVRITPDIVVDLGAGTGAALGGLRDRCPRATVVPIDLTPGMLAAGTAAGRGICADAARLPLPDDSIDLVFSNLMLHHCPAPEAVLREARRVLRSGGAVLFSAFGPTTLLQLGRAWATADRFSHIAPFPDMHDLGDALLACGFAEPVLDSQVLTITYDDFDKLIADLRHGGACNATEGRNRGLTGRAAARRLRAALKALAGPDGRWPITVEAIFAIAWAAGPRPGTTRGGEIEVPLDRLRRR